MSRPPRFSMTKTTPDGVFKVYVASEGFAPENEDEEIAGDSILQLVQMLEQLAQHIRLALDPDLQRKF